VTGAQGIIMALCLAVIVVAMNFLEYIL